MRALALPVAGVVLLAAAAVSAQRNDAFVLSRDHPAIAYTTTAAHNAVSELSRRLEAGTSLSFDPDNGYLRAVLDALDISPNSQVLVFSQTSSQAAHISPKNPRAIFFNDEVAVGWVRGGDVIEVAARDPRQGTVFYTVDQKPGTPRFTRNDRCLSCHLSWDTLGVPGMFVLSTFPMPDDPHAYASGFVSDHRQPFDQRWGGWYVTGQAAVARHMGTEAPRGELKQLFDLKGYPSEHSDVVALMVLEHQTRMNNLITRAGWEARVAEHARTAQSARVAEAVNQLVDYMLFLDEAPFDRPARGSSVFAKTFSAQGPRDGRGRSLKELDLERRLLRYPCSYMIYSEAFDALPADVKNAVYRRMWRILSGREGGEAAAAALTAADRRAIVEILRDTKKDIPPDLTEQ